MDKRFSASNTPLLAGVVKERTPEEAIKKIRYFEENGATAIDLHLSCLDNEYKTAEQIKRIVDCTNLPMLGLNYSRRYDWTEIEETEEERAELLMKSVEAGISAVDLLGYSFDPQSRAKFVGEDVYSFTKNNPLEIVTDKKVIEKQKEFINRVHGMGKEVLLSTHPDIPMNGNQVIDLVLFLAERNPDIIKIVTRCNTEDELIEAYDTMRRLKKLNLRQKISFHCCGEMGRTTRLINPILGSYMCFCTKADDGNRIKEQLDIVTAVKFFKQFGWIDSEN
jgi:3-dehydroquinate dehydratase